MNTEKLLKDLIILQLKQKLYRIKQEIENIENPPPDLKILSYGITVGYIDIITEKEIGTERLKKWKELISQGNKVIVIVPKEEKLKITDIIWKEGLSEKLSIGTYEINLFLP